MISFYRRVGLLLLFVPLCLFSTTAVAQSLTLGSPNPEEDDRLGYSVAGVADADGDGHGDLLVGTIGENTAYLFSGATGAVLHTLPLPGPAPKGGFGIEVAGVPDADGDGHGDLLIGSRPANEAYLFSGATGALLHTLTSPDSNQNGGFGRVAGVPDVDGDGRGDLLVGAAGEDTGGLFNSGRAYLFSGATGTLLHMLISPNPQLGGLFGHSVAGVTDTDGDGRGDLLVGAIGENRAYLFNGANGALLYELQPTAPNPGQFGISVSGVPDTDGDGRGDLLVGDRNGDGGFFRSGVAYLFSGATGEILYEIVSPNAEVGGLFGTSVSGVPDTDGDGRGDLLSGAPREDVVVGFDFVPNAGRVYLFSGATGELSREFLTREADAFGNFGFSVSGVSDADGDGSGDVLIGAPDERPAASSLLHEGQAYLFSGVPIALTARATSSTGVTPGGTFTFDYTIANSSTLPLSGAIRAAVRDENGILITDFGPVVTGTLSAGATFVSDAEQQVPPGTPTGRYRYVLRAETAEGIVLDRDELRITVTEGRGIRAADWPPPKFHGQFEDAVISDIAAVVPKSGASTGRVGGPLGLVVYPNPFRDQTTLSFDTKTADPIRLAVYDVLGREVSVLLDGTVEPGTQEMSFDGRGLPSGVYIWQLESDDRVATGRVILIR